MLILTPPEDLTYTCPTCGTKITMLTGPHWSWLLLFSKRFKVTAHPCHHVMSADDVESLVQQGRSQR